MSCLLQAVLGLEQLLEDGVVERLGAQQADVEDEAAGRLARLAHRHHRRHRRLAAHAHEGELLGAARRPPRRRPWCWPSRCSGCRRRRGPPRWCGPRRGSPSTTCRRPRGRRRGRRRCSRARAPRCRMADTSPPSWPISWTSGSAARARMMSLEMPSTSSGRARAAEQVGVDLGLPRRGSGGRPGCTTCSPARRGRSRRARPPPRGGTACRRPRRRRSRGRRGGRRPRSRRSRCRGRR